MALPFLLLAAALAWPAGDVAKEFGGREGALVLIDCATGETFQSDAKACAEKLAPCSTFKIWNSAIGLETGIVTDPDGLFWKWDGEKRWLEDWNKDQTLRTAYAVSCVPAYQALARKIGEKTMQEWLDRMGYGDRDISSGIDVFWLPAEGRKALLISANEQAEMVAKLVGGKLGFSEKTLAALKSVMLAKKTERGTLYGKTGTSGRPGNYGWFVGYVETDGRAYAFACLIKGDGVMGKDARAVVERVLAEKGLL